MALEADQIGHLQGITHAPLLQHGEHERALHLLEEARLAVRAWRGDAIRLDAYDAPAGAGGFSARCGFREVGRAAYRGVPLIYFEWLTD